MTPTQFIQWLAENDAPEHESEQFAKITEMVKTWQKNMNAADAARTLGIPKRTLTNIHAGRGFPYPLLLAHAIRSLELRQARHG